MTYLCTTGCNIKHSTFCPHSAFLYSLFPCVALSDLLITETVCVYCAVRAVYLHVIQVNVRFQRLTE